MIIPNSQFISHEVINWSHIESKTRFSVGVGVAYGSDVQLVKNVLLECAGDYKRISAKPKPFVRFQDFGDSSLDFSLYFWTGHTFEVENIKSDIRFMIEEKFRDNDIQIPFPQRDVHMIP
jgi:small-conductance mechanosensitive channel